jgi:hypothetical protein
MPSATIAGPKRAHHEPWNPLVCDSCGAIVDSPSWPMHAEWHGKTGQKNAHPKETLRLVFSSGDADRKPVGNGTRKSLLASLFNL